LERAVEREFSNHSAAEKKSRKRFVAGL